MLWRWNCGMKSHWLALGRQITAERRIPAPGIRIAAFRQPGVFLMSLGTILLIILILLLIGAFPSWPYSSGWGYYPAGGVGTILIIVLILVLLGRL
jgi:hypothetical protein